MFVSKQLTMWRCGAFMFPHTHIHTQMFVCGCWRYVGTYTTFLGSLQRRQKYPYIHKVFDWRWQNTKAVLLLCKNADCFWLQQLQLQLQHWQSGTLGKATTNIHAAIPQRPFHFIHWNATELMVDVSRDPYAILVRIRGCLSPPGRVCGFSLTEMITNTITTTKRT